MRVHWILCVFIALASPVSGAEPSATRNSSHYQSDAVLRGYYWEGYATAFREELTDLAYGSSSIVNHGTARTERELAWFAGYRDGVREASQLSRKVFARQVKEDAQRKTRQPMNRSNHALERPYEGCQSRK
jgi:hypothetical protein